MSYAQPDFIVRCRRVRGERVYRGFYAEHERVES
jgi:hypothetical protein